MHSVILKNFPSLVTGGQYDVERIFSLGTVNLPILCGTGGKTSRSGEEFLSSVLGYFSSPKG